MYIYKKNCNIINTNKIKIDSIEDAIEDIRNGKMIIVVDDEDRENEADVIGSPRFPSLAPAWKTSRHPLRCCPFANPVTSRATRCNSSAPRNSRLLVAT